ncbi:hypothetical protein F5Y19DRAFT_220387 [Xylariaceae sp. FL1651]|nr:hypothetical protein F5Y19DRAFT_220387 [Xylariaceae sp. FL1651]
MSPPAEPPFALAHQLNSELDVPDESSPSSLPQHLPGYPRILLRDRCRALEFLERDLCSEDLDRVADKLWWMSKQDSGNISPLHRQIVKQRAIVVTEDPKLHLVWIHNRIFIKPLPKYIVSYRFWRDHLNDKNDAIRRIRTAALGYLRTYIYLIKHESDFRIAQDPSLLLVPCDITWERFNQFAADLVSIADFDVSPRYAYGEIRLTRLNFYAPLLLRKTHFQRVEYQYRTYFARFYGPILFAIGVASVVLSGLQVTVAVQQNLPENRSQSLSAVAFWVSVTIILIFSIVFSCLCALLINKIVKEWRYAIRDRVRGLEEGRVGRRGR